MRNKLFLVIALACATVSQADESAKSQLAKRIQKLVATLPSNQKARAYDRLEKLNETESAQLLNKSDNDLRQEFNIWPPRPIPNPPPVAPRGPTDGGA